MANYAFIGPDGQVVSGSAPLSQAEALVASQYPPLAAGQTQTAPQSVFDLTAPLDFSGVDLSTFPGFSSQFDLSGPALVPAGSFDNLGRWVIYGGVGLLALWVLTRN